MKCVHCGKFFFPKQSKFFFTFFVLFVVLCALDVGITTFVIQDWQAKGYSNVLDFELNPIMKFLWQTFGLVGGSVLGFIFAVGTIFCVLRFYQYNPPNQASLGIGFLVGAYFLVFWIHLNNLLAMGLF